MPRIASRPERCEDILTFEMKEYPDTERITQVMFDGKRPT